MNKTSYKVKTCVQSIYFQLLFWKFVLILLTDVVKILTTDYK